MLAEVGRTGRPTREGTLVNKLLVGLKRSFDGPQSARPQMVCAASTMPAEAGHQAGSGARTKISRLAAPIAATPRRARAAAAASLATLALGTMVLAAPSASAASWQPTHNPLDFSSYLPSNPSAGEWADDCWVEIGFVVDTVLSSNYHHVGGVRINCSSRHSFISATVALYYAAGGRWWQWGNGTYGVRYGTSGSGSDILYTPAYCVGSYRANKWIVGATVRTEDGTWTVFSQTPQSDPTAGC
jgi:hypothetical protein